MQFEAVVSSGVNQTFPSCLVRFIRLDILRRLTVLDRGFLFLGIALLANGYYSRFVLKAGVHALPSSHTNPRLLKIPICIAPAFA